MKRQKTDRKRVAFIVQRCGLEVNGGAEVHCLQVAQHLAAYWDTEVLTTCALDYMTWDNHYPAGEEQCGQTLIRRFQVEAPRDVEQFNRLSAQLSARCAEAPLAEQEAWMQAQGPLSPDLRAYIECHADAYDAFIFFGYLYATTYGLLPLVEDKAYLAPLAHDEWPIHLSMWERLFARPRGYIFNTPEEQAFLRTRFPAIARDGLLDGPVVGVGMDQPTDCDGQRFRSRYDIDAPFLLYIGRIDPAKGCAELFQYFQHLQQAQYVGKQDRRPLKLVLLGKPVMSIPAHPDIMALGFVDEQTKWDALAACECLIMPSAYESLSMAVLEAWAAGRPVLVNGSCPVLVGQCRRAQAGLWYENREEFVGALEQLWGRTGQQLGQQGQQYVQQTYCWPVIEQYYIDILNGKVFMSTPDPKDPKDPKDPAPQQASVAEMRNTPALPLPPDQSETELREFVMSIQVEDASLEEMQNYARVDFKRFVYTLGLVPEGRHNQKDQKLVLLELGANPYFTTTLLRTFRNVELHLANFFGGGERQGKQTVTICQTGEVVAYTFDQFNTEEDTFPYEDAAFDVVLFCEILEHLLLDPVHALLEIRRVLKPDGRLILTTPNVARLENVCRMIAGENLYDPYSGYGAYGRHNREYTMHDLSRLLSDNGFELERLFTADVHPDTADGSVFADQVQPLIAYRQPDLGQYIFSCSRLQPHAKQRAPIRPDWLYRSLPALADEQADKA